MKNILMSCACACLLAGLAGCGSAPDTRGQDRQLALDELARRQVAFDLEGLKGATRRAQDDGAYLFDEAGFFDGLDDAGFKALLLQLASSRNHGLLVALRRHPREARYPPGELAAALDEAVRGGSAEVVALLLRHGATPGDRTLFHAAYRDDAGLAHLLAGMGASFERGENAEAIGMAARLGHLQTLKGFVESGKAPPVQVADALLLAALREKIDVVRYLVEQRGVDINHPARDGCTALHSLAQDGTVEMVAWMLEHGAGINATCRGKETPLRWAQYGDNRAVIDYLVAHGAVTY